MGAMDPVWEQEHFRIRDDETAADPGTPNWISTEDQATRVVIDADTLFRVRFVIANTGAANAGPDFSIYYSHEGGGYTKAAVAGLVQPDDAATPVDADTLSTAAFQLTPGTGTARAGQYDENNSAINTINQGQYSELEFCLLIDSAQVSDADTIDLQVYAADAALDVYDFTALIEVNVAAGADQTADGSPSVSKATASGAGVIERTADGAPTVSKATSDGAAKVGRSSDGSPSIGNITSEGSASIVGGEHTADGSPSITPIESAGDAEVIKSADGSPSIGPITATGDAEIVKTADGGPSISPITAEGVAEIFREAAGSPSISPITAEGVSEIIRDASGSPSISPITAAGNSFIWPKVWLNTSETLIGATEMTISSVDIDGTSITFDDSVGPPVGSLFLGVENRANGDVGWIAVTVTESVGPTVVFGAFGA